MNNERVSIVLGTMTFGEGEEGRITDRKEINKMLDLYKSYGGTELDTARMYSNGDSEQVLAELKVKESFKVQTKAFPFNKGDHSPELLRKQFMESLKALESDCVDLFYLHAPDHSIPFIDTLREVNNLYKEGKFKEFGLSNYAAWNVMEIHHICKANGFVLPTVYQGRYNIISRDVERELFPCLSKLGIRFYAYNPLCGGLLNGVFEFEDIPSDGRFRSNSIQGDRYRERYWKKVYFDALDDFKAACSKHNISTVEASFRWIINHSKLDKSKDDGNYILI
jgi:aflatoxin B1 aldehyde reductase